jgi:hypothetical protein
VLCGLSKICGVGFSFQVAVILPERAFHAVAGEGHGLGSAGMAVLPWARGWRVRHGVIGVGDYRAS